MMSHLANMTMEESSVKMPSLSLFQRSASKEFLKRWVQELMTLTELTVKPSLKRLISIWDRLPADQTRLQGVVMSMLRLASMMTAESSVMTPRASRFQRRDSRESPRQWALVLMIQTELTVRPSLRRPISI